MLNKNKYQLYISNQCSCCTKVINYLNAKKISINTINIDKDNYQLPFKLMILPALVKENKLIGYGFKDITKHLNSV